MGHLLAAEGISRQSRRLGRIHDIPSLQMVMNLLAAKAEEKGLQVYKRRIYSYPGETQADGFPHHYEFYGWLQIIDPRCVPFTIDVDGHSYAHCFHSSLELSIYDSGFIKAEYAPARKSDENPLEALLPQH